MLAGFLLIVFICSVFVLGWGYMESQRREINTHPVALKKKLPQALKILHLSDIHFSGPDAGLAAHFDQLALHTYDFVFISGDIFDCAAGIPAGAENLKKLKASQGMYAVFGNHDYYDYQFSDIALMGFRGRRHPDTLQPVEAFEKVLQEAGVKVLKNSCAKIKRGETTFAIYGLDDPTTGRADIEKTMHEYNPQEINFLLTHTVDAFFYIGENEIDLSFSGHSHGGQIRFPWIGPVITHTQYGPKYASGILNLKGAVCSISRGMAASRFFFLRLLCLPESIILNVTSEA